MRLRADLIVPRYYPVYWVLVILFSSVWKRSFWGSIAAEKGLMLVEKCRMGWKRMLIPFYFSLFFHCFRIIVLRYPRLQGRDRSQMCATVASDILIKNLYIYIKNIYKFCLRWSGNNINKIGFLIPSIRFDFWLRYNFFNSNSIFSLQFSFR